MGKSSVSQGIIEHGQEGKIFAYPNTKDLKKIKPSNGSAMGLEHVCCCW